MKSISYYVEKINSLNSENKYNSNEIQYVANYFYNLFDELSKMRIIEDGNNRELSEIEKFLFMYINITSKEKDHDDNNTSHDIIGSILRIMFQSKCF